jgi:hypothetical protein
VNGPIKGNTLLRRNRLDSLGCRCPHFANQREHLVFANEALRVGDCHIGFVAIIIRGQIELAAVNPATPPAEFASLNAASMPSRIPRPSAAASPFKAADWPKTIRSSKTPGSALAPKTETKFKAKTMTGASVTLRTEICINDFPFHEQLCRGRCAPEPAEIVFGPCLLDLRHPRIDRELRSAVHLPNPGAHPVVPAFISF